MQKHKDFEALSFGDFVSPCPACVSTTYAWMQNNNLTFTVYTCIVWGLQRLCAGLKWRRQVDGARANYAPHKTVGALKLISRLHQ